MNLDPLPITAHALDSGRSAAQVRGDGKTLTLELVLATVHASDEPMSGSASANQSAFVYGADRLRAAVVPADDRALTITF
jgi:hypothetical protein